MAKSKPHSIILISEKEKEERFINFIANLIVKITLQQVGLNPDKGSIPFRSVEVNTAKKRGRKNGMHKNQSLKKPKASLEGKKSKREFQIRKYHNQYLINKNGDLLK